VGGREADTGIQQRRESLTCEINCGKEDRISARAVIVITDTEEPDAERQRSRPGNSLREDVGRARVIASLLRIPIDASTRTIPSRLSFRSVARRFLPASRSAE